VEKVVVVRRWDIGRGAAKKGGFASLSRAVAVTYDFFFGEGTDARLNEGPAKLLRGTNDSAAAPPQAYLSSARAPERLAHGPAYTVTALSFGTSTFRVTSSPSSLT